MWDFQEILDPLERQEHLALRDSQEPRVNQEHLDALDLQVWLVRRDN